MDRTYAAELDGDGRVARVIVGSAAWATDNLGGVWVDSNAKVGAGWETYDGGLRPPPPFPSWSWNGERWDAPVPAPLGVDCLWDEAALGWRPIDGVWTEPDTDEPGAVE